MYQKGFWTTLFHFGKDNVVPALLNKRRDCTRIYPVLGSVWKTNSLQNACSAPPIELPRVKLLRLLLKSRDFAR